MMNINVDVNIKASEEITNALLTLAAVLHNAVPLFDESKSLNETSSKEWSEKEKILTKELEAQKKRHLNCFFRRS